MNIFITIITILLVCSSLSFAAPTKKVAAAFVKEMQQVVKAGDQALEMGSNQALHDHSQRMHTLKIKADKVFVQADACHFAINSALSLWTRRLLQFQKPSEVGYKLIQTAREDYRDNLELCKESLVKLK